MVLHSCEIYFEPISVSSNAINKQTIAVPSILKKYRWLKRLDVSLNKYKANTLTMTIDSRNK